MLQNEIQDGDETQVRSDAKRLIDYLAEHRHLVVAFSGGVDSSVVLSAASRCGSEKLIAVTAVSPSVAAWQLKVAKEIARELSVEHWVAETSELSRPEYQRNDSQRCFYCKETLYSSIEEEIQRRISGTPSGEVPSAPSDSSRSEISYRIASGTNRDDLGDHRPGIQAGKQSGVLTPLADLGLGKDRVRALAEYWQLRNHDLPASPCLASRIAYGVKVTPERLMRIEEAEKWLHERGFREFRVRLHEGELARIEVSGSQQRRLHDLNAEGRLTAHFRGLGFRFVTMDLQGFSSGSLNRTLVSLGENLANKE